MLYQLILNWRIQLSVTFGIHIDFFFKEPVQLLKYDFFDIEFWYRI